MPAKVIKVDRVGNRWDPDNEDEMRYWPRVAWLDPGVVSGVAVVWFDPSALFGGESLRTSILAVSAAYLRGEENGQARTFAEMAEELAAEDYPGLVVGVESFTVQRVIHSAEFLAPVRIRAKVEFALDTAGLGPVQVQSPSDALGTFGDDRLKELGLYSKGPDHINDAKRHALLWIQRLRVRGLDYFRGTHGWDESWLEREEA